MKINMFEGARRIALLVGSLWALGWVAFAVFTEPDSQVTYVIPRPGEAPVLAEKCSDDDAVESITRQTPNGDSINVRLCFAALKADSGEMLGVPKGFIPYIEERVEGRAFQLSEQGIEAATVKKRAALLEQWKNAMVTLFGGLAAGWVFVAAMGWIVRGFMGIPRGKDVRPSE